MTLQVLTEESGNHAFEVYALDGQQVMRGNLSNKLDVSSLAAGEYFLKISEKGLPVYETKKFVVIR